ncbi:hypothetical protein GCM10018963_66190 [Saccharothrix longispora]
MVRARVAARPDHPAPVTLVVSQSAALEPLGPDEPVIALDLNRPVDAVVDGCPTGEEET